MDLNINYDQTISIGEQITTQGGDFQDLLNRIVKINNDLESYWQGSDAAQYTKNVAEQAVVMQKLVDTVNEIGAFLVKVGNAYRNAAENNTLQ